MTTLAEIFPLDPVTGERVAVRVCSANTAEATAAADYVWWPAITLQPIFKLALFDGDFSSEVVPGTATMELRLDVLRNAGQFLSVLRYDWAGAEVRLHRLSEGLPLLLAVMRIERFATEDFTLALNLKVDDEPLQVDVLAAEYAGTTGAEGGADLKGRVKPWVFGRALGVEPVFIDQIDNVFQVSAYGPIEAISAVFERGASFGASQGDFASYAALVAAPISEGEWGTCLAEGMFRLGAPPAGVITCDVDGDNTAGFIRRTGAILKEMARRLGVTGSVDTDSLDALDAAVPRNVNVVIGTQISLLDLARRMAAPCNAVAGLGYDGRLVTTRVAFGGQQMRLDAQGREPPPVLGMARQNTSPPYKRIVMGANRCWRVHTLDEIAFYADLIDRGLYNPATVYREGDIVSSSDRSRWLYTSITPGSGNAPPLWPTTSNAYWANLEPPLGAESILYADGVTTVEDLKPAEGGADVTTNNQITFTNPDAFAVQANASGTTTTDLTTVTRSIIVHKGGVQLTSGVTVGTVTGLPSTAITGTASVGSGVVTVTLTLADAAGSVKVPVIVGGIAYDRTIAVNRSIASPPSGGGGGGGAFYDGTWTNISSTSFVQVTDTGATIQASAGGELSFSASALYYGGTAVIKAQYSTDGSSWTDVSGSETTGSIPIMVPGEEEPGYVSFGVTATGLTGSATYFVRLVASRTSGTSTLSWSLPTFTVSQP